MSAPRRLLLLCLLCAAPPAQGSPLSLDEVLESVERAFPLLQAAHKDRLSAEGELLAARGAFDPVLRARGALTPLGYYRNGRFDVAVEQPTPFWGTTLFGGWRLGAGAFPDYDGKLATNAYGEVRGGVLLPLVRNGPIDRRRAGVQRAELGRDAADLAVAQVRLEAVRAATLRYWEWAAAARRLALAEELLRLAVDRDSQVAERVQRGDLPAIERADNRRAIVQREAAVVAARRQLEQAALELGLYLRGRDGTLSPPPPERAPAALPEPPILTTAEVRRDLAAAPDRRPELGRLRAQRAQGEVELRYWRNQLLPGLDLSFAVSQDLGPGSSVRGPTELELGATLDVPIPNRAAQGRVRAAEAAIGRTDAQTRLQLDRVRTEIEDAVSALQAARLRVRLSREELQAARELEVGERARFQLGDSTLLLVNLREQGTYETALREVDALLDAQRAHAAYRAAIAAPPFRR